MNGSGCENCPVQPCPTLTYRGSTCTAERARFGLGDPQTNLDVIRAMSDEDLATWINDRIVCDNCVFLGSCAMPYSPERCHEGVLKWLRQPAEANPTTVEEKMIGCYISAVIGAVIGFFACALLAAGNTKKDGNNVET